MKKKIVKALFKDTNIFLLLLLIDYTVTLFSLNDTAIVISRLGIIFDHKVTENLIYTNFSVDIKMLFYYIVVLIISFAIEIFYGNKDNN